MHAAPSAHERLLEQRVWQLQQQLASSELRVELEKRYSDAAERQLRDTIRLRSTSPSACSPSAGSVASQRVPYHDRPRSPNLHPPVHARHTAPDPPSNHRAAEATDSSSASRPQPSSSRSHQPGPTASGTSHVPKAAAAASTRSALFSDSDSDGSGSPAPSASPSPPCHLPVSSAAASNSRFPATRSPRTTASSLPPAQPRQPRAMCTTPARPPAQAADASTPTSWRAAADLTTGAYNHLYLSFPAAAGPSTYSPQYPHVPLQASTFPDFPPRYPPVLPVLPGDESSPPSGNALSPPPGNASAPPPGLDSPWSCTQPRPLVLSWGSAEKAPRSWTSPSSTELGDREVQLIASSAREVLLLRADFEQLQDQLSLLQQPQGPAAAAGSTAAGSTEQRQGAGGESQQQPQQQQPALGEQQQQQQPALGVQEQQQLEREGELQGVVGASCSEQESAAGSVQQQLQQASEGERHALQLLISERSTSRDLALNSRDAMVALKDEAAEAVEKLSMRCEWLERSLEQRADVVREMERQVQEAASRQEQSELRAGRERQVHDEEMQAATQQCQLLQLQLQQQQQREEDAATASEAQLARLSQALDEQELQLQQLEQQKQRLEQQLEQLEQQKQRQEQQRGEVEERCEGLEQQCQRLQDYVQQLQQEQGAQAAGFDAARALLEASCAEACEVLERQLAGEVARGQELEERLERQLAGEVARCQELEERLERQLAGEMARCQELEERLERQLAGEVARCQELEERLKVVGVLEAQLEGAAGEVSRLEEELLRARELLIKEQEAGQELRCRCEAAECKLGEGARLEQELQVLQEAVRSCCVELAAALGEGGQRHGPGAGEVEQESGCNGASPMSQQLASELGLLCGEAAGKLESLSAAGEVQRQQRAQLEACVLELESRIQELQQQHEVWARRHAAGVEQGVEAVEAADRRAELVWQSMEQQLQQQVQQLEQQCVTSERERARQVQLLEAATQQLGQLEAQVERLQLQYLSSEHERARQAQLGEAALQQVQLLQQQCLLSEQERLRQAQLAEEAERQVQLLQQSLVQAKQQQQQLDEVEERPARRTSDMEPSAGTRSDRELCLESGRWQAEGEQRCDEAVGGAEAAAAGGREGHLAEMLAEHVGLLHELGLLPRVGQGSGAREGGGAAAGAGAEEVGAAAEAESAQEEAVAGAEQASTSVGAMDVPQSQPREPVPSSATAAATPRPSPFLRLSSLAWQGSIPLPDSLLPSGRPSLQEHEQSLISRLRQSSEALMQLAGRSRSQSVAALAQPPAVSTNPEPGCGAVPSSHLPGVSGAEKATEGCNDVPGTAPTSATLAVEERYKELTRRYDDLARQYAALQCTTLASQRQEQGQELAAAAATPGDDEMRDGGQHTVAARLRSHHGAMRGKGFEASPSNRLISLDLYYPCATEQISQVTEQEQQSTSESRSDGALVTGGVGRSQGDSHVAAMRWEGLNPADGAAQDEGLALREAVHELELLRGQVQELEVLREQVQELQARLIVTEEAAAMLRHSKVISFNITVQDDAPQSQHQQQQLLASRALEYDSRLEGCPASPGAAAVQPHRTPGRASAVVPADGTSPRDVLGAADAHALHELFNTGSAIVGSGGRCPGLSSPAQQQQVHRIVANLCGSCSRCKELQGMVLELSRQEGQQRQRVERLGQLLALLASRLACALQAFDDAQEGALAAAAEQLELVQLLLRDEEMGGAEQAETGG